MSVNKKLIFLTLWGAATVVGVGGAATYALARMNYPLPWPPTVENLNHIPAEFQLIIASVAAGIATMLLAGQITAASISKRVRRLMGDPKAISIRGNGDFAKLARHIANQAATIDDLTMRLASDQKLVAAKQFADDVIKSMFDLLIVTDPDLKIVTVNRKACAVLEYPEADLLGRSVEELFQATFSTMAPTIRRRLLDSEKQDVELTYITASGKEIPALVSISVMRDAAGAETGIILVGKDITTRKQAEHDLIEAKVAAEAASRAKSAFLANMSHEIRTPMTAILGFADLLLGPVQTDAERRKHIETIRRNGQHLLSVINDILDVSKIEAGKMGVECIPCAPAQIVSDVCSLMAVRASDKKLSFSLRYTTKIPETIHSDPTRLRQILMNLIGNAIKFTSSGSVVVMVGTSEPRRDQPRRLRFDVVDSGPGMTPSQLETLFRPFMQADSSTTRKFGGTGLGLTISKHLAEKLGGEISVRSEAGSGTTFSVSIATGDIDGVPMIDSPPVRLDTPAIPPEAAASRLRGNVLLAEDGPDNQALIRFYLEQRGLGVTIVPDGAQARDTALAARAAGRPFDLILMDMQMPELDGYGATAQLREAGYDLPIIALTANAMDTDRDKCLASGCTDFVNKPIDPALFFATLARYLPEAAGEEHAPPVLRDESHDVLKMLLDRPGMAPLVERFVSGLEGRLDAIRRAVEDGDQQSLKLLAHQLKGAAGGYGFPSISHAAKALESATSAEFDLAEAKRCIEQLSSLARSASNEVGSSRSPGS